MFVAALQGCAGTIPKDGPTGFEVREQAEVTLDDPGRLSYAMVKLTPLVLSTIQTEPQAPVLFSRMTERTPAAEARVAASDTLTLSIFESGSGGLFIPSDAGARPGNFVQIPPQEVDRNGNINVPFAGPILALGRTPREIETAIVSKLKTRAIEPQVIVSIGDRSSDAVTVLGDVRGGATIPVKPGGLRLLAALARAGGSSAPAHSSVVTLQRRGHNEQALLTSIVADPRQNIQLIPGDVVYVANEPRVFMAFGALGNSGSVSFSGASGGSTSFSAGRRFTIDRANMTLSEAIAAAGGIASSTADTTAVFLFRYTPRKTLERAGVDVSAFPDGQVPTVFTADLGRAEGYFLANHLFIKHNDILYVAESPSVDLLKFLNIVNAVSGTISSLTGNVSGVAGAVSAVKALR